MEYYALNITCLIIVIIVCWFGIKLYPKGTNGRFIFVFLLLTSFVPYIAITYIAVSIILLILSLMMWIISKLSGI